MGMIILGIANKTGAQITQDLTDYYVEYFSQKYSTRKIKIEKALVRAIIAQECDNKPYSMRPEAHMMMNPSYLRHIPKRYMPDKMAYCSLGAMQVMYGTARWLGFRKEPEKLILQRYSIQYGIKYLQYLIKKYWSIEKVISSYNQGSPRKDTDGRFYNQKYVNEVLRYYQKCGGKIRVSVNK